MIQEQGYNITGIRIKDMYSQMDVCSYILVT